MRFIFAAILCLSTLLAHSQRIINLEAIRSKYNIPELGYAVVTADGIIDMKVTGFHRSDSRTSQDLGTPDDYFYLGDNTKAITGFIAARLAEDLKIKWVTEFFSLYPDWKKDANKAYQHITLQQLVSGRSGIPSVDDLAIARLKLTGNDSLQRILLGKHLIKQPPARPGRDSVYINEAGAYILAALMLEKVSGKSWEQLVTQCLSGHMGLRVGFSWPNRTDSLQPWGHKFINNKYCPIAPDTSGSALLAPATDIKMPLADYARFVQTNVRGLMGIDSMLTGDMYRYLHFGYKDYSMGWNNGIKDNHAFSESFSSNPAFYCHTFIDNTNAIAFIIVANANSKEIQDGLSQLMFSLNRKYVQ